MSITKRTREQMGSFRSAVTTEKSNSHNFITTEEQKNTEESVENLRKKQIEQRAENILEKGNKRIKKNPLDVHSRCVPVTVSPRTEALWRHCANQEDRRMSEWVRRAVDFYIRKHGME